MNGLKLGEVYVEELPSEQQGDASREIRNFLQGLESVGSKLGLPQAIELDVLLVSDMVPHVDRIGNEYGRYAESSYSPKRNAVVAVGMTLTDVKRPPLRASIVLNQKSWLDDEGDSVLLRAYLLFHEIGHVFQEAQDEQVVLIPNSGPLSVLEEIGYEARILWNEANADRVANRLCRIFLRNDRGDPVGPDLWVNRYAGAAADCLDLICKFITKDIQAYRRNEIGIEKISTRGPELVRELMRILAHCIGLSADQEAVDALTVALANVPGFSEIVGPDWNSFAKEMMASEPDPKAVAKTWVSVLSRLGLTFEDLDDGRRYLHVNESAIVLPTSASEAE